MQVSVLKALAFIVVAAVAVMAAGPLVGLGAALAGTSRVPVWAYAGTVSLLLLGATAVALVLERSGSSAKAGPRFDCRMGRSGMPSFIGMKPPALAGRNSRLSGTWTELWLTPDVR